MNITITPQELGTILAALRFWQQALHTGELSDLWDSEVLDIASDGGAFKPLDEEQIDVLCEDLNSFEKALKFPAPSVTVSKEDQAVIRDAAGIIAKQANQNLLQ
jgi:hypothetical protein